MVTILVLFEFGKVCPGGGYGAAEFQIFYQGLERLSNPLRQSPYLLGGPGREFNFPHIGTIITIWLAIMSIVNLAEQVGIVAGALKDDEAKGVDSGGGAGRLQKAGVTASEDDGWPGRIANRFTRKDAGFR